MCSRQPPRAAPSLCPLRSTPPAGQARGLPSNGLPPHLLVPGDLRSLMGVGPGPTAGGNCTDPVYSPTPDILWAQKGPGTPTRQGARPVPWRHLVVCGLGAQPL